jgi:YihY family inner membrane protein
MNVDSIRRSVDQAQQNHGASAFVVAVIKKFSDDRAGNLAAMVTYYAFLSIFPALLLFMTILGFVLHGDPHLRDQLVDSALADFPVVGSQLGKNVDALDGSVFAVVIGSVGLLWGSLGIANSLQHGMAEVWDVPATERPSFVARTLRALLLLLLLGISVVASVAASALTATVPNAWIAGAAALAVGLGLNVVLAFAGFRILTPDPIDSHDLFAGATVAGIGWTALQLVGGWLVARQLRHASELYGFFGIVLGLLFFLFLAARLFFYAAEVNVVRGRRLYPRSLTSGDRTEADERVFTAAAEAETRVDDESVDVSFDHPEKAHR